MGKLNIFIHRYSIYRCNSSGAISLFIILSLITKATFADDKEIVTKDTDMQAIYFLDKYAIAHMTDMEQYIFQPERVDGLIAFEGKPAGVTYFNIYYDRKQKLYKMWYKPSANGPLCYIESKDGIDWTPPDLVGKTSIKLSKPVNGVFNGSGLFKYGSVFYDPNDKDASRRYKLPYEDGPGKDKEDGPMKGNRGMRLAYSPDGLNWQIDTSPSWHTAHTADTENNMFYNPFAEKWQIITRVTGSERRVAMVESKDLKTWSEPIVIVHPSPLDPLGMEFYGMKVTMYEDIFLGLLWRFETGTSGKLTANQNDGIIESELTYSYNGDIWNRTYRSLIGHSQRERYTGARIYSDCLLLDHEDNIRIYSKVFGHEHGSSSDAGGGGVVLHKMRKDGFAGLESIGAEGFLQTKLFLIKGGNLTLNIKAPYGSVKVQVSDKNAKPYPGFSFEDCTEWHGDDIAYRPRWIGKTDLSELVGEKVRFEVKMREGIIYSIRVPINMSYEPTIKRM